MADLRERVRINIMGQGTPTLVNRREVRVFGQPLKACWARAQANRVTQFDNDTSDNHPMYEVALPADVLDAPIRLTTGDELTWVSTGWRALIRAIDPQDVRGVIVGVLAIVSIQPTAASVSGGARHD